MPFSDWNHACSLLVGSVVIRNGHERWIHGDCCCCSKHSLFCRLLWTLVLLFYGTEGGLQICKRFFFWIFLLLEHSFTSCLLNSIECIIKSSYPMEAFLTSFPLNIPGQKVHYMGIWFCMPNECDWIIRYTYTCGLGWTDWTAQPSHEDRLCFVTGWHLKWDTYVYHTNPSTFFSLLCVCCRYSYPPFA